MIPAIFPLWKNSLKSAVLACQHLVRFHLDLYTGVKHKPCNLSFILGTGRSDRGPRSVSRHGGGVIMLSFGSHSQ